MKFLLNLKLSVPAISFLVSDVYPFSDFLGNVAVGPKLPPATVFWEGSKPAPVYWRRGCHSRCIDTVVVRGHLVPAAEVLLADSVGFLFAANSAAHDWWGFSDEASWPSVVKSRVWNGATSASSNKGRGSW